MMNQKPHLLSFARWAFRCPFTIILCYFAALDGPAQTNDWIAPGSGNWDVAANWSLGLPNASQSEVRIVNVGSKAVAIQPATPVNAPGSMTVQNLRVGGVPPGTNLLLLNFFGTTTPLRVVNDLHVESNGRVLMLYSGLNASNINLNGVFEQEGGTLTFTNSLASIMQVEGGRFNLTNGVVNGANMYFGGTNDGYAKQDNGVVVLNWLVLGSKPSVPGSPAGGTYVLQDGWLVVSEHELVGQNGFGTFHQNGGTNSTSDLAVGNGTYVKNGGGLFADELRVIAPSEPIFAPPAAVMTHAGGTAIITTDLSLNGVSSRLNPRPAMFNMLGGSLAANRILIESAGRLTQSNGTVNVATEVFIENSGSVSGVYLLAGGNLFTAKTTVSSPSWDPSYFSQSGGTHIMTNQLSINGTAVYQLMGGTVSVSNIVFTGNINLPPQFFVVGAPPYVVTNEAVSLTGGAFVIQDSAQRFGRVTLKSDSGINLAGTSAILRFADSHTNSWSSELVGVVPRLLVYNWNGSTNGGGTDQLSFGTNSSSLTASQLAQIGFINAAGFPPGTNHARILATGEVVPTLVSQPTLSFQNTGTNLVLSWPGNFILQSATNVVGPYLDVTNATSPYSADVQQFPMQFFRLRE